MDIFAEKEKIDDEIKKIINLLKFKNNPIVLKGSANLQSQKYFSDYDLFSLIKKKYSPIEIYNTFIDIINKITSNENYYLLEFKIQTKDEKKIRWYEQKDFNFQELFNVNNLDFCKIDLIVFTHNIFTEVSCIYKFLSPEEKEISDKKLKESLYEDITELKKEGKYYKALKRYFNIFKIENKKKLILELNDIFNSEIGKKYQIMSNLEAIQKLKENFKLDKLDKKKIIVNLKDIGLKPNSNINNHIEKLKNEINKEAFIILKENNL